MFTKKIKTGLWFLWVLLLRVLHGLYFIVSPKINETLFGGRGDLAPTETEVSQYY